MALIKTNARSSSALDATILTGNLPAISGASLTGISGGKVLQHQFDSDTSLISFSNTSFVDTNLSIDFTPTSASSQILTFGFIQLYHDGGSSSHGQTAIKVISGGSQVGEDITTLIGYGGNEAFWSGMIGFSVREAASDTSQRTIKVQVRNASSGASASYNQYAGLSTLNIMEIA